MILVTSNFIMWYWIIVGIVALVALLIHTAIAEGGSFDLEDLFDDIFDEYGWVTFLAVLGLGGIVFGFIAWVWWAMLLIICVPIAIVVIYLIIDSRDSYYDNNVVQESNSAEETGYECSSCGAKLSKIVSYDDYGRKRVNFKCPYCNNTYSKDQILGLLDSSKSISFIDLDDWEEEYFEVCDLMFFRPYNRHTMKQIDRKHEKLQEKIDNFEDLYDGNGLDDEDILNSAYDFFSDNEDEIEDYFKKYTEEEIKNRYDFYTKYNSMINEED